MDACSADVGIVRLSTGHVSIEGVPPCRMLLVNSIAVFKVEAFKVFNAEDSSIVCV
jgi:hypothetical protein